MSSLEALRIQLGQLGYPHTALHGALPFGVEEIDAALPEGGIAFGAFHEITEGISGMTHCAAATLFAAGILARMQGQILWCRKYTDLFAPALAQVGLPLNRLIFVDAGDEKTLLACVEEGLRHGGVAAVVGEISKLSMTASRRLQLAAETSGTTGIAIRRFWRAEDAEELKQPTAARTRWRVSALPSASLPVQGIGRARWMVELLRCRSGRTAQFEVEACDEKGYLALSPDLVNRPREKTPPAYAAC